MMTFLHSGWAYITLITLLAATFNSIFRYKKVDFTDRDFRLSLFALITAHIQLVLGLITYFASPRFALWSELGMGVMKSSLARKLLVEHPLINILAIALITIGWSKHKKVAKSDRKFKNIMIFYGLGLILILSRIPWKIWFS